MQSHKITVRPGDYLDVPWAVEVGCYKSLTEDLKRPDLVNKPHWYELANTIIRDGISFVAEKDGELIGYIFGFLNKHMFNPEVISCSVISWYVLPEYRNTRASYLLIKNMEMEAKSANAESLCFLLPSDTNLKVNSLEKSGFKTTENVFSKTLKE